MSGNVLREVTPESNQYIEAVNEIRDTHIPALDARLSEIDAEVNAMRGSSDNTTRYMRAGMLQEVLDLYRPQVESLKTRLSNLESQDLSDLSIDNRRWNGLDNTELNERNSETITEIRNLGLTARRTLPERIQLAYETAVGPRMEGTGGVIDTNAANYDAASLEVNAPVTGTEFVATNLDSVELRAGIQARVQLRSGRLNVRDGLMNVTSQIRNGARVVTTGNELQMSIPDSRGNQVPTRMLEVTDATTGASLGYVSARYLVGEASNVNGEPNMTNA